MEFVLFGQDAKRPGTWGYVIPRSRALVSRVWGGGPKAQASLRNSSCQPLAQQLAGHVGQVGGGEAEVFGQGLARAGGTEGGHAEHGTVQASTHNGLMEGKERYRMLYESQRKGAKANAE